MTRRRILPLLAIAWAIATGATAVDPSPPGTLAVEVAISNDPGFVTEWMSTPKSHAPTIKRVKGAQLGDTVHIAFIVSGHRVDERGVPDLLIDVVVRRPDGSVMADLPAYSRVGYRTGSNGFVLGDPVMDFIFESHDPPGTWRIEATAHDRRAGTSASRASTLLVTSAPSA